MTRNLKSSKLETKAAEIRRVINSPEWGIFREWAEIQLRELFALMLAEPKKAESRAIEAKALIDLFMGFEAEFAKIDNWLSLHKFTEDQKSRESMDVVSQQGVPRPYRES